MPTTFDTSSRQFFMALDHYTKSLPIESDKAMRRQFRILIQRIMAWTPPHGGSGGNTEKSLKVGEAAVRRDIMYWIKIYNPAVLEWLLDQNKGSQFMDHRTFKTRTGRTWLVDKTLLDPTGGYLPEQHADRRDARGRVPMASSKRQSVDVGRHTSRNLVGTTQAAADRYVARMQKHVGLAKSGWVAAFSALGGASPAWIARHGGGNGRFVGGVKKTGVHLMAENHAKSIGSLAPRLVKSSIDAQRKAMIRELEKASVDSKFKARLMRDIAKS